MNNKKHILAFTLSLATSVAATIPHDEVVMQSSPLIQAAQLAENTQTDESCDTEKALLVTVTMEKTGLQELTNNEQAPVSDLQVEATRTITTLEMNIQESAPYSITIEEARAILGGDATDLADGFTFEHEGRKYIIKTAVVSQKNMLFEENKK